MIRKVNLPPAIRNPVEPVIKPRLGKQYWWESLGTFNPGVTEYQGQVVLLYRAYDPFRISRLGLAVSDDGISFTQLEYPAVDTDPDNPYERLGIEDPRITKIGSDYYIVHTCASYYAFGHTADVSSPQALDSLPWRTRIGIKKTNDFISFESAGYLPNVPAKNGLLLPEKMGDEFGLYYREGDDLTVAYSPNLQDWHNATKIEWPEPGNGQNLKFGTGSQLIPTPQGNLMVYHTVDSQQVYRLGLMMFSLANPTQIIWYSNPILSPEMPYEKEGFVPNVVYCCGAIIRNNELWIYYGAADQVIGRAIWPLSGLPAI